MQALQERPSLHAAGLAYWTAFWTLQSSRSVGMSLGAIPLSEIHTYCQLHGIEDVAQRLRLTRIVMRMDGAYLELIHQPEKDVADA